MHISHMRQQCRISDSTDPLAKDSWRRIQQLTIIGASSGNTATRTTEHPLPHHLLWYDRWPSSQADYRLTFWEGANDSRLPNTPGGPQQNVPLETFIANLHTILTHAHITGRPDLRIILITPPPVDERMLRAADGANIPGFDGLRRKAKTTAQYAQAVRQVGKEKGLQVCDVWSAMMKEAGWREGDAGLLPGSEDAAENAVLRNFFSDGKHIILPRYLRKRHC